MTRSKRGVLIAVAFSALSLGAVPTATAAGSAATADGGASAHQLSKPKSCKSGNFCMRSKSGSIMVSSPGNWYVGDDRSYWAMSVENAGKPGKVDHIKVKSRLTHGPVNTSCVARGHKVTFNQSTSMLSIEWVKSC